MPLPIQHTSKRDDQGSKGNKIEKVSLVSMLREAREVLRRLVGTMRRAGAIDERVKQKIQYSKVEVLSSDAYYYLLF
jgi:hypothetical protein